MTISVSWTHPLTMPLVHLFVTPVSSIERLTKEFFKRLGQPVLSMSLTETVRKFNIFSNINLLDYVNDFHTEKEIIVV